MPVSVSNISLKTDMFLDDRSGMMRMAVIMTTIVFSVHKKLFSFGSPQNRNFPAVEKEIAKKNSSRKQLH